MVYELTILSPYFCILPGEAAIFIYMYFDIIILYICYRQWIGKIG